MNRLRIYILFWLINLSAVQLFAQQDSIHLEAKKSITEKPLTDSLAHKQAGKLFVGVDLYSPALSAFSDRQGGMAFASYRIYKKWNLVAEIGYESNTYDNLDWLVDVNGNYFKFGFNWFISQDYQDLSSGFYTGARFAYSAYKQEIKQYPVRLAGNQVDAYGSLPKESVSTYWIEMAGGARLRLISKLYADVSLKSQILIGGKKQQDIDPLVIPGYGKNRGSINFGVVWGLSWKFF